MQARKRNFDEVRSREEAQAEEMEIQASVKRILADPELHRPFPIVPEAVSWLTVFHDDRLRYPFLIVLCASGTEKTERAQSIQEFFSHQNRASRLFPINPARVQASRA